MFAPVACESERLSCADGGKTSSDGDQITVACHLESANGIPRIFGMVGDSFHDALEMLQGRLSRVGSLRVRFL
jgi:hypothetical protein